MKYYLGHQHLLHFRFELATKVNYSISLEEITIVDRDLVKIEKIR